MKLRRSALLACFALLAAPRSEAARVTGGVLDQPSEASATSTILPLWPGDDLAAVTREIIVLDRPDDPNSIKRGILRPSLTIYRPQRGTANGAALVVIPGGAYRRLFLTAGGYDFANLLVAHGYTVGLLKYRMADPDRTGLGTPLPIADGIRAMRLLRSKAGELGLNSKWIGVVGTSAGCHIAASCAAFGDDGNPAAADAVERVSSRPDFVILHAAVISMEPDLMHESIRVALLGEHPDPKMVERYSLEKQVGPSWPPTLLVFARDDTISPQNSLRLMAAIRREGRPVQALIYDTGGHAFALHNLEGPRAEWPQKWLEWMRALTGAAR